ncbi:helix-turn-helix transcriptional regulator [Micromonospora sp. NPDC005324]|uniref:helix-turn-helix domain-containing protein n=1 Tax=Micromonospora sp. NPDC005324 TaxID=3157033 RepID=UPI0033B36542
MNVNDELDNGISPTIWEHQEMRTALAARDLTAVYQRLQRNGVSQRKIATAAGQAPSEVYEVLNGRQVMSYNVLARIADGLGIPRGYMGLAYAESNGSPLDIIASACSPDVGEREETRRLLSYAAEVTLGVGEQELTRWWQMTPQPTPIPRRIGETDVAHLLGVTQIMRAMDYRHGGGACRDAVLAQVSWATRLLQSSCTSEVSRNLFRALADLHNLAGWTSFDVGLYSAARAHFAHALEHAKRAEDSSLVANVLYRMGRLHLHRGLYRQSLRFFQLGQIAAQDSGCELTVSMLCANEAWAMALAGDEAQAEKSIRRAHDEFHRAGGTQAPSWVSFFSASDLHALTGMTYAASASLPEGRAELAISELERSIESRDAAMTRSQIFELTALATVHIRAGSYRDGVALGNQALTLANEVRSIRTIDRIEPLQAAAEQSQEHDPAVQALAERAARLRTT